MNNRIDAHWFTGGVTAVEHDTLPCVFRGLFVVLIEVQEREIIFEGVLFGECDEAFLFVEVKKMMRHSSLGSLFYNGNEYRLVVRKIYFGDSIVYLQNKNINLNLV